MAAAATYSASSGLDVLLAAVAVDELKNSPPLGPVRSYEYENSRRGLPSAPPPAPSALPTASYYDGPSGDDSESPPARDRRPRKKRHVSRVSVNSSSGPVKKIRHGGEVAARPPADGLGAMTGLPPPPSAGEIHHRTSFPALLMAMMSDPECRDVITFLSDGANFIVVQPDALVGRVLPAYLEGPAPTIEQFHDMLDAWGFETKIDPQYQVRIVNHPQFRRGDWDSALRMRPVCPYDAADFAEPTPPHARPRHMSMSESARSVTPPQLPAAPSPSADHQRRAFPQQHAAVWQDSRAAESMLGAETAEMRRRLALMALRAEERRRLLRDVAHGARPAPTAPPAAVRPTPCPWSDAEILVATETTVSAALDVLNGSAPPSPSAGGRPVDAGELDRIDSMSRHFLGSSMRRLEARRLIWSRAFPPSSFSGVAMPARK